MRIQTHAVRRTEAAEKHGGRAACGVAPRDDPRRWDRCVDSGGRVESDQKRCVDGGWRVQWPCRPCWRDRRVVSTAGPGDQSIASLSATRVDDDSSCTMAVAMVVVGLE